VSEADRQLAVYASGARRYDALVSAEDCDSSLGPALASVFPLAGTRVIDVGAGTGRLSRILAEAGAAPIGVDRARAMLAIAAERGQPRVAVADARALPFRDAVADAACAGWVFGHFPHWEPGRWRQDAGRALGEMRRVVRPGGWLVVLESLGTATQMAAAPTPALAEYHRWLETEHGFRRRVLRTDYRFASPEEAASLCGFFFGERTEARVRAAGSARVPEHTGMWHRTV